MNKIPVLMYHSIKTLEDQPRDVYSIHIDEFKAHMNYLKFNHYRVASLHELIGLNSDNKGRFDRSVAITFDDGYADNYTHACPVLKDYGFTAAFFVTIHYIGQAGFMSWEHLREMRAQGMLIGSHMVSHKNLISMLPDDIQREMIESKRIIEKNLSHPVDLLSIPHYFSNTKIHEMAFAAGYKAVCISDAGYNTIGVQKPVIKRINIRDDYSLREFKKIVQMSPSFVAALKIQKAVSYCLRKMLGRERYERLKKQ